MKDQAFEVIAQTFPLSCAVIYIFISL